MKRRLKSHWGMRIHSHLPLRAVTVLVLLCGLGLASIGGADFVQPTSASGALSRDEIDDVRRQILELEKDIAARQAKWDKLYAEYLRVMNVTGGRLNSTAESRVSRLDADARKIKADIDAQKAVLAATREHLERLEMARAHQQEAQEAQRDRKSRPGPSLGDGTQNGEGDSSGLGHEPPLSRRLPRVLLVDLSDPVGAGGACAARYRVDRLGFAGIDVGESLSFTVSFDGSGFPVRVPGYREYRDSSRGGVEVLDGELQPTALFTSSQATEVDGVSTLRVDRVLGEDRRESGLRFGFSLGPLGLRLVSVEYESRRLMFEYDLIGASLPPLWQQIGSAGGTDRLTFDYYPSGRVSAARWDLESITYSYGSEGRLEELELHERETALLRIDFDGWDEGGRWVSARCLAVDSLGHERPMAQLRRVFDGGPEAPAFRRREFNLLEGPIVVRELPPAESPRLVQVSKTGPEQGPTRPPSQRGAAQQPTPVPTAGSGERQPDSSVGLGSERQQPSSEGRATVNPPAATNFGAWIILGCLYAIVGVVLGWRVTPTWTYDWIASSMISARGFVQSTGIGQAKSGAVGMSEGAAEFRAKVLQFGVRLLVAMLFGSSLMLLWMVGWCRRGLSRREGRQ